VRKYVTKADHNVPPGQIQSISNYWEEQPCHLIALSAFTFVSNYRLECER